MVSLVPRTRTELGRRNFPVAAPTVWNSLPAHLRSTLISRRQFRDGLKSHLFANAYFWSSENIRYKSVMYLLTYSETARPVMLNCCVCMCVAVGTVRVCIGSCCTGSPFSAAASGYAL